MKRFLLWFRWRIVPPAVWFWWAAWIAFFALWLPGGSLWSWGRVGFDPAWTLPWLAVSGFAALVGAARLRGWTARRSTDPRRVAHQALYAAVQALPRQPAEAAWLNRDAHLVFIVKHHPRLHLINITQIDEDDLRTIGEEGSAGLLARTWLVLRWSPDVARRTAGAVVTLDDLGAGRNPFPKSRLLPALRAEAQARKAGLLYATIEEMDELTRLLGDVELIQPDGDN